MATGVVAGGGREAKTAGNLVCDLDGVLYLDTEPIPGAGDALTALERTGMRILLVTNNSTRTADQTAAKLADVVGYPADPAQVLGSGQAAAELLRGGAGPVFVVGETGLVGTLEAAGLAVTGDWRAATTVVVGLDRWVTYARLRDAALAVRAGARFVATNADPTYPTPDGQVPGCGALVAFIAAAAGTAPEVAGKPHAAARALVRAALGPGPTYVVGDRVDTDLEMGRLEGWERVLVLTGVTSDAGGLDGDHRPELVLPSIADLPDALRR